MFSISRRSYESVLRVLAVLSSVTMMFISAQFSVDGFAFQNPNRVYIGWLLALILIVVEMIFNNGIASVEDSQDAQEARRNTILMIAGFAAYAYGIATNVSGILHSGRLPDSPFDYIVPVALGLFLEIVPEPLMVWALITQNSYKFNKNQNQGNRQRQQPQYHSSAPSQSHQKSQRVTPDLTTEAILQRIRDNRRGG